MRRVMPKMAWLVATRTESLQKGFADVFESVEEAERVLGTPLVPAKLGLVRKLREDGSEKLRIIWDFRASIPSTSFRLLIATVLIVFISTFFTRQ